MQIGGKSKAKFVPVAEELSFAVYYKKNESDEWQVDHGLSKYQQKVRAQSYADAGLIVEKRRD